jgi:hypothetical protein
MSERRRSAGVVTQYLSEALGLNLFESEAL